MVSLGQLFATVAIGSWAREGSCHLSQGFRRGRGRGIKGEGKGGHTLCVMGISLFLYIKCLKVLSDVGMQPGRLASPTLQCPSHGEPVLPPKRGPPLPWRRLFYTTGSSSDCSHEPPALPLPLAFRMSLSSDNSCGERGKSHFWACPGTTSHTCFSSRCPALGTWEASVFWR